MSWMDRRNWSALQLERVCGQPTKRTINRWKKQAAGQTDFCVTVAYQSVVSVAEALGVAPEELLDANSMGQGSELGRYLNLAAALGPVLYPSLMNGLGLSSPIGPLLDEGLFVPMRSAPLEAYRVVRWALCERRLAAGAELNVEEAGRARDWAGQRGLTPDVAPALHCMCALWAGESRDALVSGLMWMRRVEGEGRFSEVAWVGRRLLEGPAARSLMNERVEVALLCARAVRVIGDTRACIVVLTDVLFNYPAGLSPVLLARLHLGLAFARIHSGDVRGGLAAATVALDVLDPTDGNDVRFRAMLEQLSCHYLLGDGDAVDETLAAIRRLIRKVPNAPVHRFSRTMGIAALERGDMDSALQHFHETVDMARVCRDQRAAGIGIVHVGIASALAGDYGSARTAFEQAVALFSSGEGGPFGMALVQLNFAELELDQLELAAVARRLTVAEAQLAEAGGAYPALFHRVHYLRAVASMAADDFEAAGQHAQLALRRAVESGVAMDTAVAFAVCAAASRHHPETAEGFAVTAEHTLAGQSAATYLPARYEVGRLCAFARLSGPGALTAAISLKRLASETADCGLFGLSERCLRTLPGQKKHGTSKKRSR